MIFDEELSIDELELLSKTCYELDNSGGSWTFVVPSPHAESIAVREHIAEK